MDSDLISRHLRWMRERGLAESYVLTRGRKIGYLAQAVGKPLMKINENDLSEWRSGLQLSPDSVRGEIAHVHQFFDWLLREHRIRVNPADHLTIPRAKRRLPRPIIESALQLALISAVPDIRMMLVLAAGCGLRACELAILRWDAVVVEARYIMVTGKGGKQRVVSITDWVLRELELYGIRGSGWVFRRLDGGTKGNAPNVISGRCNDYLHGLGFTDTLHSLRHRFATRFLDANPSDVRKLQELLGHESLTTTAVYTLVSTRESAAAMARMPSPLDNVGALPGQSLDQACTAEPRDGLPGGGPADLKLVHQLPLGGDPLLLGQLPGLDALLKDLADLLGSRLAATRIDQAHDTNVTSL